MNNSNINRKPFCGKPVKMVLVSNPCYFFALPPQCYLSSTERLTVKDNGKVLFKSTMFSTHSGMRDGSPEGKHGEWADLSLIPFDAKELLGEVAEIFSKYSDSIEVTDVGSWEITLTNTDGEDFLYTGSLFPESFEGCTRISDYIRAKLRMDELLCFDGGSRPKEYIYLSVRFGNHGKSYYYQTDDESIDVGDQVIVPVGDYGAERIVDVVKVRKYTEDNLPMPLNKVKSIIGKFEMTETVYCPICEKDISPSDCSLIEMTAEGLCPPNECDDFVKPGLIKERASVCLNCRYHSPDAYPIKPTDINNTVVDQNIEDDVLEKAHKFSSGNKPSLLNDKVCGCFECLRIFDPKEIDEYYTDDNECDRLGTAICPYCSLDTIIGESSGYPITPKFLKSMHRYWMESGSTQVLKTPFGDVQIFFDSEPVTFYDRSLDPHERYYPDVDGTHRLTFDYTPDGNSHILRCEIFTDQYERDYESGELFEAVSFYRKGGKITLGASCAFAQEKEYGFDFTGSLFGTGIELSLNPRTKKQQFGFGVCWVNNVTDDNGCQTWYGADPYYQLKSKSDRAEERSDGN